MPTGATHLVVRLASAPLLVFEGAADERPRAVGHTIIGGARSSSYVKSVAEPARSVGAQLWPGAALALLGAPASEFAEQHTPLDAVWGRRAGLARERIAEARSLASRLDIFEALLLAQLARAPQHATAQPPALTQALTLFEAGATIAEVVRQSGTSHRTFLTRFHASVGLTPKVYCRVRRFQRALNALTHERPRLIDLALATGYADQAHLTREFTALAGISPAAHRALAPAAPNHVPLR